MLRLDGGEPDVVILVGKLELAAAEDRWRYPEDDNVALHMAKLEAIKPDHEAIPRIQKTAAEHLTARAQTAVSEKRWHDAIEAYRVLHAIDPSFRDKKAMKVFATALEQEAKILLYMKDRDPEQLLLVADDFHSLGRHFDGYMMRATAFETQGMWREAADSYAIAKKLKPQDRRAREAFARADKKAKAAGM